MTNSPSGKFSSGPRSTSGYPWSTKAGRRRSRAIGSVTMPPMAAPMPSVDASRKRLRPIGAARRRRPQARRPDSRARLAGAAPAARASPARIQRNPNTTAMIAPITVTHRLTIRPMRTSAMPPGEGEGPDRGSGKMRLRLAAARGLSPGRSRSSATKLPSVDHALLQAAALFLPHHDSCQRRSVCLKTLEIRPFPASSDSMPYSSHRRSTASRISWVISIRSGHGRAPSVSHLCVASMPSLPP